MWTSSDEYKPMLQYHLDRLYGEVMSSLCALHSNVSLHYSWGRTPHNIDDDDNNMKEDTVKDLTTSQWREPERIANCICALKKIAHRSDCGIERLRDSGLCAENICACLCICVLDCDNNTKWDIGENANELGRNKQSICWRDSIDMTFIVWLSNQCTNDELVFAF